MKLLHHPSQQFQFLTRGVNLPVVTRDQLSPGETAIGFDGSAWCVYTMTTDKLLRVVAKAPTINSALFTAR